jgi:alkyl sulfatase BDS1-like metallo-beta-lactamase superfamily hydrolase
VSGSSEAARPGPASAHTRALRTASLNELPFEDREDFEDARRGLIATAPSLVLRDARGRVVWDMDRYDFVDSQAEPPDTVHPSLWRLAQLNGMHRLFEVVPGIYQVRGYDLSNMTLVEGRRGVIVIDPLISMECAAAALALYRSHRGERPVSAVIYTHSHVDHFGGVKGVVCEDAVHAGVVPVWAPAGFLEHAVSENVLAGTAMGRRAGYMFAPGLQRGPRGQVDAGIGKTTSSGSVTLIPPTHEVSVTGQEEDIDGVPVVFQLVPRIVQFLERHRDMYRYLHDQTLRLANRGFTPTEIAAQVTLPPSLARSWSCRGYYGTVSHNVRAVYQRYLGFFDGNPAHLDPLPPEDAARPEWIRQSDRHQAASADRVRAAQGSSSSSTILPSPLRSSIVRNASTASSSA